MPADDHSPLWGPLQDFGDTLSSRASNQDPLVLDAERLDRYQLVMRHEFDGLTRPTLRTLDVFLSDLERGLIADVLAATPSTTSVILSLDSEVVEAMRSGSLPKKWHVDPMELASKLRAMTTGQKCAVIEAFERGRLRTRGLPDEMTRW